MITRLRKFVDGLDGGQSEFTQRTGIPQASLSRYWTPDGMWPSRRVDRIFKTVSGGHLHAGNFDDLVDPETGLTREEMSASAAPIGAKDAEAAS